MTFRTCRIDDPFGQLAAELTARHGVSDKELDAGYRVLRSDRAHRPFVAVNGQGDGCSSPQEVFNSAFQAAIAESLLTCGGSSALLALLADDYRIRFPGIPYADGATGVRLDQEAWSETSQRIAAIRTALIAEGCSPQDAGFRKALARRIFQEMVPAGPPDRADPLGDTWRYFAYAAAAGLQPGFVMVATPGLTPWSSFEHVAIAIPLDASSQLIVDPTLQAFDLQGYRALPLDPAQALSLAYTCRAYASPAPLEDLGVALTIDPGNARAQILQAFSRTTEPDPLQYEREAFWMEWAVSRDAVARR